MEIGLWGLARRIWGLPLGDKLRLVGDLLWDRRVPLTAKLVVLVTVVYLLQPFDLVPDFIPLLGQLDDLLAIGIATVLVLQITPKWVVAEHVAALERR